MNTDRFKFRIWDNKNKQYLNTADLYIDSNGIIHAHKWVWGEYKNANENLIVEQCTGLKDASGKLVYEGDIIGILFHPVVKWDYSRSCFVLDDGHPYKPLVNRAILYMSLIVGNIHENPKLLEDKK